MTSAEDISGSDNSENDTSPTETSKSKKKKSKDAAFRVLDQELAKAQTEKTKAQEKYTFRFKSEKPDSGGDPLKDEGRQEANSSEADENNIEEITPEEEAHLNKSLREEARRKRLEEGASGALDPDELIALDSFDAKIIDENKDPQTARDEVLAEWDLEAPEVESEALELPVNPTEGQPVEAAPDAIENMPEEVPISHAQADQKEASATLPSYGVASDSIPPQFRSTSRPTIPGTGEGQPWSGIDYAPPYHPSAPNKGRPSVITQKKVEYIDLSNGFMTGNLYIGSLDYLIGRRRGRIKAERRLMPVQKKLEGKIRQLEEDLNQKEYVIRKLVREKARAKDVNPQKNRISNRMNIQNASEATIMTERMERERSIAPEAQRLHGNQNATERIGHLLVTGEVPGRSPDKAKTSGQTEARAPRRTEYVEPLSDKTIETMSQAELLKLSTKIMVNGNSLRQIYETHLIGERGLRRLVAEHTHGGDVTRALRHEIVEREIDFERDPIMRDAAHSNSEAQNGSGDSKAVLKRMINDAEDSLASQEEELAFYKAKADYENKERVRQQQQRKAVDTAIVSVVAVLIVIVAFLYLSRG